MTKYKQFIFLDYEFSPDEKKLTLQYQIDGQVFFREIYEFDFPYTDYSPEALDHAVQSLFFMSGVSYYKTYLPPEIIVKKGHLDEADAKFYAKTYQKGLGELFYLNNLDPKTPVNFQANSPPLSATDSGSGEGLLVAIGGGKDSLVSAELLRNQPKVATWTAGSRIQLEPLIAKLGHPHFWVKRNWDISLLNHYEAGANKGHVPYSAILSCVGTVVAILTGYRDVVVSNESSANEPTLSYRGVDINHQYSKSSEYEEDFQAHLKRHLGGSVRYYSLLRPFTELYITEMFSKLAFDKYHDLFSSCNRAFTRKSDRLFWCGQCAKCAFAFLVLTPFLPREKIERLWEGKNLLLDPSLEPTYKQLLGIAGDKPMDCVGEIKESRAAMKMAQKIYPELSKYPFDIPDDYDYRTLSAHNMPPEIYAILEKQLGTLN